MSGGDGCGYVEVDVGLGRVMIARRSVRILFTVILLGLVITDSLVSCVLNLSYCVLRFVKISLIVLI